MLLPLLLLLLLLQVQTFPVLCLCFQGALQHNDGAELVQHCIVLPTVHVLNACWTAAG